MQQRGLTGGASSRPLPMAWQRTSPVLRLATLLIALAGLGLFFLPIDEGPRFLVAGSLLFTVAYMLALTILGDRGIKYMLIVPSTLLLGGITVAPLIYLIVLSFHKVTMMNFRSKWPFAGLANYMSLLQDPLVKGAFIRTFEYTAINLILQMVLGFLLALLMQRTFKGRSLVSTILLIPVMACPIVVALLWSYLFGQHGGLFNLLLGKLGVAPIPWLSNTPLPFVNRLGSAGPWLAQTLNLNWGFVALIITNTWQWTPFVYLLFLAGLSALPQEPYEAAQIDGASSWQVLRYITLPLLRPVIGVVFVIRLVDLLKVYDQIYALFGESVVMRTLNIHIVVKGLGNQDYGVGAALSMVVLLLTAVAVFFYLGQGARKEAN
ncbi:MAG: sugar ABC transporter permease [Firmicutes bacterium]|nr:sugar ABC transporter permease [Bacillota bacterium]MCL5039298.1 sugar ABC transporter permease [Bacillota bacterium]